MSLTRNSLVTAPLPRPADKHRRLAAAAAGRPQGKPEAAAQRCAATANVTCTAALSHESEPETGWAARWLAGLRLGPGLGRVGCISLAQSFPLEP